MERGIKESKLREAEKRITYPMYVEGQRQPLPKLYWGAGESQRTYRLPAQSHSLFSKGVVSTPVLDSVQARTGDRLDSAFRSSQA